MDEFNTYLAPDKPFLLICRNLDDTGDVLFWCKTELELNWIAENNTAVRPYDAFEIGSMREISFVQR